MILALGQFNPTVGDVSGNAARMKDLALQAKGSGAALVVFPELSLTGYPPRDLLDYSLLVERNLEQLKIVASATTDDFAVVCGFIDRNTRAAGAPFANGAAFLRRGKVEAVYHKQLLPTYDVFDERRFFEPGQGPLTFEHGGKRFAVTICEDAWNLPGYLARPYREQPLDLIRKGTVDWVLNLSASPFHLGKPETRCRLFAEVAKRTGAHFLFCNQVGANDELIFDGASLVLSPAGEILLKGPVFKEALLPFRSGAKAEMAQWPSEDFLWLRPALVLGIADYARKTGVQKAVLGLSGGVDSSLAACLAAEALGGGAVTGLSLPTRFTSTESREDAAALARQLGLGFREFPIEELRQKFTELWRLNMGTDLKSLTAENVQPRLRMTALMALANEQNALLLNTSNKSELATGYSTLYGDTAGALAVLGDLTKRQVYGVARTYGTKIPSRVLTRPPTAELREGQKDEDTLPPYEILDSLVVESLEKGRSQGALLMAGWDAKAVGTFSRLYRGSEYKRHQFPPILRVSAHAFGVGRRVPIASVKSF